VTGTSGGDTFNGTNTTLQATDVIRGGDGRDTLNYVDASVGGTNLPVADIAGIEVINVRNVGQGTAATFETATVTFTNLGAGETATVGAVTPAAALTAAQQVALFSQAANTPAGYEVVSTTANSVTYRATVAGNAADVTVAGSASASAPSVAIVQGVAAGAVATNTFSAANLIGAQEFNTVNSIGAVTITDLATGQSLGMTGNGATTVGALTGTYAATVTSTTLNLKDGLQTGAAGGTLQGAGAVTINGAGIATANINSTGAANAVGGVTFGGAAITTLNIKADSAFGLTAANTITGFSATQTSTVNVTGAGAVRVNALDAALDVYNASAATGAQTLSLGAATQQVTLGSGNDVVTTNGIGLTTGSVAAGAGTADRLIVTASADITAVTGAKYTNFEVLQVENGVSVDLDHVAGITGIRINGAAGATGVTDLSAAQAANVTVVGAAAGAAITIGVKNAAVVGQIDTLALTIDDGLAAKNTLTLGTPTLTGVENISINAVDNVTITALTSAAAITKLTLTGAGDQTITTGALATNPNTVIDGSAATGVLTINAALATTNPLAITGGTAADVITTSARADVVNGKGGLDSITITAGNATVQSEVIAAADADRITGFVTGTNKFDYNGVLANGTAAAPGITTTGTSEVLTSATTFAASLVDVAAAGNSIVFIAQSNVAAVAGGTALTTLVGDFTAANITAFENALVGTGGALNGAITNLDSIFGATDAVLLVLDNGTHSAVLRITNTDTSTVNTLTAAEIEVVGVFRDTAALAAGDFV